MALPFKGQPWTRQEMEEAERRAAPGVLTEEQQAKLRRENIARCKAQAEEARRWREKYGEAADGKAVRAKKRTHTGVHHTYTGARLRTSLLDRIA